MVRSARRGSAVVARTMVGILVALVTVSGPATAFARSTRAGRSSGPVTVAAAFYPLAYAAEAVGGGRVRVTNLTPAGVEPHDLELTTTQRDRIEDADLVVVMGSGFQPSVEKAAEQRDGRTVDVLDRIGPEDPEDPEDPHVWLDVRRMQDIVELVARALARVDPAGADRYDTNTARVTDALEALDERYRTGLADCDRRLIVTAHEAFGHLARAYGLVQRGVVGLTPDAEPDPKRLAELADLVEEKGVTTVFTEELASPRIARTLAREAGGVKTATLDPLEGLARRARARGDDYIRVMDRNLAVLRTALGCR